MRRNADALCRARAERGAALFLLLLLLLVGAGIVFVTGLKTTAVELAAQRKTVAALAQAKAALLGWTLLDTGGTTANPGRLPCPDQDNDGNAQGAACGAPYVGWLPWRTLAVDDLRDGSGERLWMLVDKDFRSGSGAMNTTLQPTLTLDGRPVVAIVLAPGPVLSALSQNRPGSGPFSAASLYPSYIEGFDAAARTVTTAPPSATYNDRVIAITPQEIFAAVTQRIARELAEANPPGPGGYTATAIGDLVKPPVWMHNGWDAAVDTVASGVTTTAITVKFVNCAIVYTITGTHAVRRTPGSC